MPWRWSRHTPPALADLVAALPRGAVAVDCGANVGSVAAALARRCSLVVAFEPNPVAFAALEQRLGRAKNVRLVSAAVGAENGKQNLFLHVDHDTDPLRVSTGSSLYGAKGNVSSRRFVEVDVVDLDAYLREIDRPVDLLKLDVEGAEVEILERLLETGRLETIGRVVVEMHDGAIPELSERGARVRQRLSDERYGHVSLDWQ